MKAFITGGSGFIGRHLVEKLLALNWQVRILVHRTPVPWTKECEIISGDIRELRLLREGLEGVDILFHLAAALGGSIIDKEEFFQINARGTENVLTAARESGVKRIVHFSSAGVLGSVRRGEVADENYPLNPQDVYDQSKLEAEKVASNQARDGLPVVIIRAGWVYGPGDRRTFKLIRAIARKRFILVTRGKAWQTPVQIDDLVGGTLLAAERGRPGEIYNLAGKEVLTVREIAEAIAEAAGTKIPGFRLPLFPVNTAAWALSRAFRLFKKEAPLTPGRLAFFLHPKPLSILKAQQELGYVPLHDFKTGMTAAVAWYRKHGWL